ncbi:restriction endonuclease subunit S [Falsirhodobacter xinxiangensis]|uniref:restriction endonuclease subunit S n=1 Tax=Falsirhodobacter xinxiangensis TaxID=2530049 RepID=UPI0010A9FF1F|nr:restriction endonuclease subunit S [Rhodobacter xinxiangensis]
MSDLPEIWTTAPIKDVFVINPKHDPKINRQVEVSFIPMPSVDEHLGAITAHRVKPLSDVWKGFTHFAEGDVIFAKITPCMENGKTAIARNLTNGLACGSTEFHVLRPTEVVSAEYIWRYLRQKSFRADAEGAMTGAVGQRRVPKLFLEERELPIPPLPEQRRIVATLDRLSTRSAAARDHLARTTKLATRAKQAILDAAFSGHLTENWRDAHKYHLTKTVVGDVATILSGYGFPKKFQGKIEGRFPFAKVSDLSNAVKAHRGRLSYAVNYVDEADLKDMRARPASAGSTAFAKIGEALKLNRRALLQQDTILDNNCMALRPDESRISREFLFLFMHTVDLAPFSVATTVPSVRRGDVERLPLLLPEREEQAEIVRRIEAAFARIDRMTDEASRAAHLLDRLDERLLAKAFRGELVPQDPEDEPAEALLTRIRQSRSSAPNRNGTRRTKT